MREEKKAAPAAVAVPSDAELFALMEKHLGLAPRRDDTVIDRLTGRFHDAQRYREFAREVLAAAAPQPPVAAPVAQGDAEDAARYRWLRRWKGQEHEPPFTVQHEMDGTMWGDDLDAAIDAARAQAKEGGAA